MNNLYLIGGTERSGKTAILHRILKTKPMIAIQTDAIRRGMEKALLDDMDVIAPISNISISGDVFFQYQIDNSNKEIKDIIKQFSKKVSESKLVWDTIVGLISYYDKASRLIPKGSIEKGVDLIIEGVEINPERVKCLKLKNFSVKPVFVGFTEDTDFDKSIIDFKMEGFKIDNSDLDFLREGFNEHVKKGKQIKNDANRCGYKFFSFDNNNFERFCNGVVDYLVSEK